MKVDIISTDGKSTGRSVDLPDDIFGIEPNEHSVYLAVKRYLANQRQGTHKAKEKGEITASTRKIKKQKGTGTARAGSMKSPLFKGGGRVFGPRPRSYRQDLNKKVIRLARASALSQKVKDGNLKVVENFTFEAPRTKDYVGVLNNLEIATKKSLIVTGETNKNLVLSGRNIAHSTISLASTINTYEVMKNDVLVLTEDSIGKIKETFSAK